jgi:hypothetical protein
MQRLMHSVFCDVGLSSTLLPWQGQAVVFTQLTEASRRRNALSTTDAELTLMAVLCRSAAVSPGHAGDTAFALPAPQSLVDIGRHFFIGMSIIDDC